MATLSADGNTFSEEQSRAFLERAADHWKSHGFGLWICREDAGGDFVGYGGIRHATVEGCDQVELAYAIRSEHWGKGFATEISIVAFTLTHNRASRGVMEHCGFSYQRDIVHAGLPHVLYLLEARNFAPRS
jgi:[ribosomal protein S5]-alanine N-acetyltransferase